MLAEQSVSEHYEVVWRGTDRRQFLAARAGGLGASDIAAILGFSKWKTPHDVWLDKTGRSPGFAGSEAARWGLRMENAIAVEFQVRHGRPDAEKPIGRVRPSPGVLRSRKHPVLFATPDRLLEEFDTGFVSPLEIKQQNAFGASEWDPEPPMYYQAQSQAQQLVFFGDEPAPDAHGWIVPLIGGNQMPDPFRLAFDHEFAVEYLLEYAQKWWADYVLADVAPPLTPRDDVATLRPVIRGTKIKATPEILALIHERTDEVAPAKTKATARDDEIKGQLKVFMGENAAIVTEAGTELVTWDFPKTAPKNEDVFDLDAFKAAHPALAQEFTVTRPKAQSRTMYFK